MDKMILEMILTIKFPGIDDTYFKVMFLHLLLENAQDPKQCSIIRAMKKCAMKISSVYLSLLRVNL